MLADHQQLVFSSLSTVALGTSHAVQEIKRPTILEYGEEWEAQYRRNFTFLLAVRIPPRGAVLAPNRPPNHH